MAGNHALVFGASGLAGWAVVDELLSNYPERGVFTKVTAAVNRPLKVEESFWPQASFDRPELSLVTGVNLTDGTPEEFAAFLKDKIKDIDTVTHVYYFAYKQDSDWDLEARENTAMFTRAVHALDKLSPALKFIAFPSGTRGYGIHLPTPPHRAPYRETMDAHPPPSPSSPPIFYHAYQRLLRAASAGRPWTWAELRPDAIVGFAPHGSTYNLTAHWATYLSAVALVRGLGATVAFPGTAACWAARSNECGAGMLARSAVWASLHGESMGGELFNVADTARPVAMSERWPALAAYFGLVGTGPVDGGEGFERPSVFVEGQREVLEERGVRVQVWQGGFLDTVGEYLSFDRYMSLEKIREAGFGEEVDPIGSWYKAFERFKAAGMIV